jgi:hypothetical protein
LNSVLEQWHPAVEGGGPGWPRSFTESFWRTQSRAAAFNFSWGGWANHSVYPRSLGLFCSSSTRGLARLTTPPPFPCSSFLVHGCYVLVPSEKSACHASGGVAAALACGKYLGKIKGAVGARLGRVRGPPVAANRDIDIALSFSRCELGVGIPLPMSIRGAFGQPSALGHKQIETHTHTRPIYGSSWGCLCPPCPT